MMRRLAEAWKHYWFRPAPLLDIAVVRIIIVAYQLHFLWTHNFPGLFARQARLPDALYDPLVVVRLFLAPLGSTVRPSEEALFIVFWATVAFGCLALAGLFTNAALGLFAIGNLFMQGYLYSFGDFHHGEGLVMISLAVLALGPSGRVLSLDNLLRRWRRGGSRERSLPSDGVLNAESEFARWPLLLIRWVIALAYLSAAYMKLRPAGLDWANGHTLKYYVIRDGLRLDIDIALWLADQHWLTVVLSWFTLLWEGSFFLVLVFPALALLYVPLGVALHMGIHVMMRATFFGFLACYSVFVPWRAIILRLSRRDGGSGSAA
jgi:hypothetical protein